jgi:hypothetical protein
VEQAVGRPEAVVEWLAGGLHWGGVDRRDGPAGADRDREVLEARVTFEQRLDRPGIGDTGEQAISSSRQTPVAASTTDR